MYLSCERYGLTLGEAAHRAATRDPSRVVCRCGTRSFTLADIDAQATQLANGLIAQGFRSGDRAAVLMPSHPECLILLVALARAGGITEFLLPHYGGVELARMLQSVPPRWLFYASSHYTEASVVVTEHAPITVALEDESNAQFDWSALLAEGNSGLPEVTVSPDNDAMILFTSGTTGDPKAVRRSHNSVMSHGVLYNHCLELDAGSIMGGMQFSQETTAQLLADGGCLVIANVLQPGEWLATIERERITHIGGVTSMLQLWLSFHGWSEFDLSSVRCVAVGAMATSKEVHRLTRERLGISPIQMYGTIEAGLLAVNDTVDEQHITALGLPLECKEFRIIDERGALSPPGATGELLVRPAGIYEFGFMRGYCDDSRTPKADGWLHTGDLVYQDADGYLFLVGRTFETINVAGHKVYAPEVERVLCMHRAVAEAAVIGHPNTPHGEIVAAYVILRPGHAHHMIINELRIHCRDYLAWHKIPKHLIVQESLPRTATGKVNKQVLRNRLNED